MFISVVAFVACDDENNDFGGYDCYCIAIIADMKFPLSYEGEPTIEGWNGDCEGLIFSDLASQWAAFEGEGVTLRCVEY